MLATEIPRAVDFLQAMPQSALPEQIKSGWDTMRRQTPFELPPDPTMLRD